MSDSFSCMCSVYHFYHICTRQILVVEQSHVLFFLSEPTVTIYSVITGKHVGWLSALLHQAILWSNNQSRLPDITQGFHHGMQFVQLLL